MCFAQSTSAAEIPRFYFPDGMEIPEESIAASHSKINAAFEKADPAGITAEGLVEVMREVRSVQPRLFSLDVTISLSTSRGSSVL
jgi:hypothetical protein